MIVGNGMIAKAFAFYQNNKKIIIFASGVSNSKEINNDAFNREKTLLIKTIDENKNSLFVYFSTCSIEDNSVITSNYVIHKKSMEEIVKERSKDYFIFRLPQVVGIGNSPTLINSFVDSIMNNKFFSIYENATRNLIDVDDVFKICFELISEKKYLNEVINVASPYNTRVTVITSILEKLLNKKANFKVVPKGSVHQIDITKLNDLDFKFNKNYLEDVLVKYLRKRLTLND